MKIIIKKTIDFTAPLATYIDMKLAAIEKFVKSFEKEGEAELWIEISRTTKHHNKGEVFKAVADLRLPKKILRAEAYAEDVRTAIDEARNTLRFEIEKYKKQFVEVRKKRP